MGRQAQCFWCSRCHSRRCLSVALLGILFCLCHSLFMPHATAWGAATTSGLHPIVTWCRWRSDWARRIPRGTAFHSRGTCVASRWHASLIVSQQSEGTGHANCEGQRSRYEDRTTDVSASCGQCGNAGVDSDRRSGAGATGKRSREYGRGYPTGLVGEDSAWSEAVAECGAGATDCDWSGGWSLDIRATIEAYEMAPRMSAERAEARAMNNLLIDWPRHGTLVRSHIQIDGTQALLVRGPRFIPGNQPVALVAFVYRNPTGTIWSRNRPVYMMFLPGKRVNARQQSIISSIRFIPRTHYFPCATSPFLSLAPNPVALHKRLSVVLSCAKPSRYYSFEMSPWKPGGFGGGNMGTRRAGAYGMVEFSYPPMTKKWESGRWILHAYDRTTKKQVATAELFVRRHG
jgi:hypothetical protein